MVQAMDPVEPNADRAIRVNREAPAAAPKPEHEVTSEAPRTEAAPADELDMAMQKAVNEALGSKPNHQAPQKDDVTVEPYRPSAQPVANIDDEPKPRDVEPRQTYVPQSAERVAPRRMPRADELPRVAQESVAQAQQEPQKEPGNARALFRRLASNVGLQGKEEFDEKKS